MMRIAMFLFAVIVVSTCAAAQAPDAAIETALLAAPANLRLVAVDNLLASLRP